MYDQGVDIWALGCSLYMMYTQEYLFDGKNDRMILLFTDFTDR